MLSIHYVSIMMRIFYIDWQQHWECDPTMNIGDQQNSHKGQEAGHSGPLQHRPPPHRPPINNGPQPHRLPAAGIDSFIVVQQTKS